MLETTPGICNYFKVTKKPCPYVIVYKVIYFCNIVALESFEGSSQPDKNFSFDTNHIHI